MKISMIAAMDGNRIIGRGGGGIPWDLPRDRRRFRGYAAGKHLLIGRRTFEEMEGWFESDQTPIVLTHQRDFDPGLANARTAHSVDEAISEAFEAGADELVVCGGASVYAAALPYSDELILTLVGAEVANGAGVRFPDYHEEIEWDTVEEQSHPADSENPCALNFVTLHRVRPSSLRPGRLRLL